MTNVRSFFKFLSRNKAYTAINLFGLSISLMFVILIANYTINECTVDKGVEKADRIYTIASEQFIGSGFWNGQKLHARYPEIENYCNAVAQGEMDIKIQETKYNAEYLCVDTSFFSMFSTQLIEGDTKTALISTDNVVVSEQFARKAFGTESPIGKTIKFAGESNKERVVVGIIPNFDNSVFPNFDLLMNSMVMSNYNPGITVESMDNSATTAVFLLTRKGADLTSKTDEIAEYFKEYFWPYKGGAFKKVILVPFNDIYFSPINSFSCLRRGEPKLLAILIAVGTLILLFSILNYINLTTAQTGFRAKEMATRRLLGSSRAALFGNLIFESFIMCAIALIIGLILAALASPFINSLLYSEIDISTNLSWSYMSMYLAATVLLAVISGAIPAYVISNFKPIEVVRGSFRRKNSMIYSKFLIGLQNIITIALIGGSITMLWQYNHLLNAPMGYTYDNIIDISTWNGFRDYAQVKEVRNSLLQLPCVDDVALSAGTPLSGGNNNTISYGNDNMVSFQQLIGDSSFFKMLNLRIKRDNHPAELTYYYNEHAFKELGLSEDVPSIKFGKNKDSENPVAGVFYDFKVRNMLSKPMSVRLMNVKDYDNIQGQDWFNFPWDILVKINGNQDIAFETVKNTVLKITEAPEFEGDYIANNIKKSYAEQGRILRILLIFTGIAIIISTLGLLAMSTYYIQQRQMEVAVRKIFGSTSNEVLLKLVSNFMKIVLIAFVVAIPVIWVVMNHWLSDFDYRIALSPLIFVGAGIISCIISFISVYWQSNRAANTNPIKWLKN